MAHLPQGFTRRLGSGLAADLEKVIDAVGEELALVYAQTCDDHLESRGDNSQVFGLRIWTRGDFRLTGRFEDSNKVQVEHSKGSYKLCLEQLSMGCYKLGHSVDEDIHLAFPDESPTKRAYGELNRQQLSFFECPVVSPLPADVRYQLDELVIGHFGNPRDGLTKWYVGAMVTDDLERPSWAWIERQDLPGEARMPGGQRPPIAPFDSREVPTLRVEPKRRPTGT
jgi:hypothetical protein